MGKNVIVLFCSSIGCQRPVESSLFWFKSPLLALGIIFVLLILIVRTIQLFIKIERFMAYLLYPYLAWVIFASFLNLGIVYLN